MTEQETESKVTLSWVESEILIALGRSSALPGKTVPALGMT